MEMLIGNFMALWAAGCTWEIDGIARHTGRPVSEDVRERASGDISTGETPSGNTVSDLVVGSSLGDVLETADGLARQVRLGHPKPLIWQEFRVLLDTLVDLGSAPVRLLIER